MKKRKSYSNKPATTNSGQRSDSQASTDWKAPKASRRKNNKRVKGY